MSKFVLIDKCIRISFDKFTEKCEKVENEIYHKFDSIISAKQFVNQTIICIESNIKAKVFRDLQVNDWQSSNNEKINTRLVKVIEDLPSHNEITQIIHIFIMYEELFRY